MHTPIRPYSHTPILLPLLLCALCVSVVSLSSVAHADRFALVVGIDDYEAFGKLKVCRNDAKELAKVLVERAGFPEKRVVLLTDDAEEPQNQPTRGTLRRRIEQVTGLAGKDDTVLIFFSGHGITADGQGYLVPSDGDADPANDVPLSWVKQKLGSCQASSKILILDACHSGSAAKGVSEIVPSLAADAVNTVMLLSCKAKQISYPKGQHSVFSESLIDGLRGAADTDNDQTITHLELFAHIKSKLTDWCLEEGKTQTPVVFPEELKPMQISKVVAPPREAYLVIRSEPAGAEVWIDGERHGRAGEKLTIPTGDRGTVSLEYALRLDGYRALPGRILLRRGETSEPALLRLEKASLLPPGLEGAFEVPSEAKDQYGNPVLKGIGAKVKLPKEIWHRATGMEFILIEPGEFMMGSDEKDDEKPVHKVRITKPFYLGKYEVTQGQWKKVLRTEPWADKKFAEANDRHAVAWVSWDDCQEFLKKASSSRVLLSLPSEAQWEYGCRAGSTAKYSFGDDASKLGEYAWFEGNAADAGKAYAQPVGRKKPNTWGLYDMLGNVGELCEDVSHQNYEGAPADGSAWIVGEDQKCRVCRGGSCGTAPSLTRSAYRFLGIPSRAGDSGLGFRISLRDF